MRIRTKISLMAFALTVVSLGSFGLRSLIVLGSEVRGQVEQNVRNVTGLSRRMIELSFADKTREIDIALSALEERTGQTLRIDPEAPTRSQVVRHQDTGEETSIEVPSVLLDGRALLQPGRAFADRYSTVLGGDEVTIFLIHEIGLVRYDTSIENTDGESAQWSYIPTADERYRRLVMENAPEFTGTAEIVGETYLTDYRRLGADFVLFVGVRQVDLDTLRAAFATIRVGETGFPFVVDGEGTALIHPTLAGQDLSALPYVQRMLAEPSGPVRFIEASDQGEVARAGFFESVPELGWRVAVAPAEEESLASVRSIRLLTTISMTVLGAAALILSWIVGRRISRPIERIAAVSGEFAAAGGDLTRAIEIESKDETGALAANFNSFVARIREIVQSIKNTAGDAGALKEHLVSSSNEAGVATNQISSNIDSIRKTADRLNEGSATARAAVERITETINSFRSQVNEQVSAVEEATSSVDEMAASIQNIARVSEKRSDEVQNLQRASQTGNNVVNEITKLVDAYRTRLSEINEASELIQGVAAQTNLLAMNAAIEAAHAGDAGRGFAVVAAEIRKLAEQTSERSHAIEDTVSRFTQELAHIGSTGAQLRAAFDEVSEKVDSSARAFEEIGATTREMSVGSEEIVRSMGLLRETSSRVDQGSRDIETESESIRNQIEDVDSGTASIAGSLTEVSQGITEINSSVDNVRNSVVELGEKIDEMAEGVNSFKTEVPA